jgi:hypothetical protein
MCAKSGESNIETRAFALSVTQYIYPNQTVIRCASYIKCVLKKKHIYVGKWVLSTWGIKRKQMLMS